MKTYIYKVDKLCCGEGVQMKCYLLIKLNKVKIYTILDLSKVETVLGV